MSAMDFLHQIRLGSYQLALSVPGILKLCNYLQNVAAITYIFGLQLSTFLFYNKHVERAQQEVSILQYNDENALSYTISLAFYYAWEYYTIIRELLAGKGYADVCFIPRRAYADKPALLIELKWDKSVEMAMDQIKRKRYLDALKECADNLLIAGIVYDKAKKKHECQIEKM